ncbi:MAG: ribose 5-phosphate isomerase B [Micavibrio sp.]|nr:ribose 5-phosphate isomerase B [Micavibrio sp.]
MPNAAKKLVIASDHAGFALKTALIAHLRSAGHDVTDLGTHSEDRVDYPDYGFAIGKAIEEGMAPWAIGICGSGIGISIAMNRFAAVRTALVHDVTTARFARLHNNANAIALGARMIGMQTALDCVDEFLSTDFEGGRHTGRVEKLANCGVK